TGTGVAVSHDDGRTYAAPAAGPSGPVVAAAVSRADAATLLVLTAAPGGTSAVWRSTDGGARFLPAGAVPAGAAAVAFDAWSAGTVWLAAPEGAGAGVWQSTDSGTTWRLVSGGAAYDVDVARRAASGLVVVARADGLWRTTDGAATWSRTATPALSAARVDSGGPGALALAGGVPVRVAERGRPAAVTAGLPRGCAASALAADAALPTTFVLRCGDGWYATVSDAAPDAADGGTPGPGLPGGAVRALRRLRQLRVPRADGASSGSLAFDGRALYYAGDFHGGATGVHRMSPVDGRDLGTLRPAVAPKFLTYDAASDHLYVDDGRAMWRADGRTGRAALAFPATFGYQWSWDAASRTFLGVNEADPAKDMLTLDATGTVTGRCSLTSAIAVSTPYGTPSAVVAATDGAYVVLEDDATVLRVRRDCTPQATYLARRFSESALENDGMVCDPLTFAPGTALWIRDSQAESVAAYDLPDGYCPFVTRLSVAAPRVRDGERARVCATLRRAGRGEPVPGQPVTLDADGTVLAAPPTDAHGRTCATVRARRSARRPVVRARFAGTAQWTPASATATALVLPRLAARAVARPPVARPPVVPDAGGPGDPMPARVLPPAPPPPPADPAPIPHPQPHPNAQHQPGAQPGAQAGLLPDEERQGAPSVVLADQAGDADEYAMSARPVPVAAFLGGAALVTAAGAAALHLQTSSRPVPLLPGEGRSRRPRRRGHAVRRGR
ncbi:MAG TPA: hypothetical protein VFQ85_15850, partial [Mycobacteriales bacterium]|nr:hypothetical protein [Mycobacteriales bacterium]